jgi:outer membrane protein assembly factor BamE
MNIRDNEKVKWLKNILIVGICYSLVACSGVKLSTWRFPYMMEVQQGTYITQDQLSQIKVGMTKDNVLFILGGYPLSQYMFDQNRWDFMYQDYKNNSLKKSYDVTIFFNQDNAVTSIQKNGDLFSK